jgi:Heterokaryon incompatibility protein (HET)
MADSTSGQAVTQQLSWTQRIPIGRTLQLLAGNFKHALGFGGQSPKERELLGQRDDLQGRVDFLLADKHEFASKIDCENRRLQDEHSKQLRETRETYTAQIDGLKAELEASRAAAKEAETVSESKLASLTSRIATLDEGNKRLRELREKEAQAHHDRVESMQVQLNTGEAELEAVQTRLREMEVLTQDKDSAHQAHLQSLEEQLKAARESLDSFKTSAEEKNSAQRAEIDAKAHQVVDLQAGLDEMRLQLDSKDDRLRSTLKDLKAKPVDSEDERVRSIIAKIESGLTQMIYPTIAEQRLQDPVRKSYKHRMRQMQAARQRLLQDSKKQPESTAFDTELDTGSDGATGSGQSATDNDDDDRILEYVLSSMKVALPRSVAGQTAEVFFAPDDNYLFPDDKSDPSSPHEPHTEQHMQQQASTRTRKPVPRAVLPDAEEIKRQEFYSRWPRRIHSYLPLDENSIRLVEILAGSGDEPVKVRMAVHRLKDVSRQYEALSYVCGEAQRGHWITLNGEKIEIYPNLHNALTWLRRPTSTRRMWVDAMCINQRSKNEKSKEIHRMGPIYNQAKTVNIFLGAPLPSEADSIGTFIRFLNRGLDSIAISRQDHERYEALENLYDTYEVNIQEVCQGFIKFCLQPWWTRIWTMVSAIHFCKFPSLHCQLVVIQNRRFPF